MTVGGAVCEFNPFHNGHKYFLESMRSSGADGIICIMSGNFVQRGEIAICDKYARAESAVKNGADLVIELPIPYAVSTAETFARGSIGILNKLGCVDNLFFGAENSLEDIIHALNECEKEDVQLKIKTLLNKGISYPDAVSSATENTVLSGANNVLAIEYIRQLNTLNSEIKPLRIERIGTYHDEKDERNGFLSASAIRERLKDGKNCDKFLPEKVCKIADTKKLEIAILSKLRTMSVSQLRQIADVNEGLEFRIKDSIINSTSLDEILSAIKTKRYTNAKIRRILLCAYLGVTKEIQEELPSYIRVLATNKTGLEIIKMVKEKSNISVVCRHADSENLNESDKALYDFSNTCDDLFSLALPEVEKCGYNQRKKFEVIDTMT